MEKVKFTQLGTAVKKPCKSCPFTQDGVSKVYTFCDRKNKNFIDGLTKFTCHCTIAGDEAKRGRKECMGFLLFAQANGLISESQEFAELLGVEYDLPTSKEVRDKICTREEFIAKHRRQP